MEVYRRTPLSTGIRAVDGIQVRRGMRGAGRTAGMRTTAAGNAGRMEGGKMTDSW